MEFQVQIFSFLLIIVTVSNGQIVLTQSPASKASSPGERVTFTCSASSSDSVVGTSQLFYWVLRCLHALSLLHSPITASSLAVCSPLEHNGKETKTVIVQEIRPTIDNWDILNMKSFCSKGEQSFS
ncbi:hypothetical protein STEG23_018257 [Scotinomys teguina]